MKLSKAQKKSLAILHLHGSRFIRMDTLYDFAKMGLAERVQTHARFMWRITDLGRKALEGGE